MVKNGQMFINNTTQVLCSLTSVVCAQLPSSFMYCVRLGSNPQTGLSLCCVFGLHIILDHNQINAHALIGQSAMFIVPVKSWENRTSTELLYKTNRSQVSMV